MSDVNLNNSDKKKRSSKSKLTEENPFDQLLKDQGVMRPSWKNKGSEAKALAKPISKSILDLKSAFIKSNSKGILVGRTVLLDCNIEQANLLTQTFFGRFGRKEGNDIWWFEFTLEEAFYLCFSLKCIKIVGGDGSVKTDNELWEYMICQDVAFPDVFKAYAHLRDKNWVVTRGGQYGADFVAYRHHPSLVHSECAVLVLSEKKADRLRVWSDYECMLRECDGVVKTLLVLYVNRNDEKMIASSPSCLEGYGVDERTVTRWWSAERRREDQAAM
uniref:tRNA-splicing endonuclease subunit Sen2-1-like n=1 Tax=Erigeron canadensis TaxID=72917 RepID=UPI001CB9B95D|nr:tRNA-splicing endonuclease subunit Sen2-1-like [Erigeron canadensis]